jgi:stage V sporulation protein G
MEINGINLTVSIISGIITSGKTGKIRQKVVACLEITDVRVFLSSQEGITKAYASITFDNAFVVKDIRVIDGRNGLFISMPSRKDARGEFRDICHPITNEMRNSIQDAVLNKYREIA